ncbi:hypothetical protein [Telmatospirillum sp. J64-1]|uniref:hypothetical protein n=1 Tax=Telmatospirillum sp. J64-1 TaxID=2502183 RepID=UPI00115C9E6C|nr:hypothetical protein [Telmatospirillum sp. J64-1]
MLPAPGRPFPQPGFAEALNQQQDGIPRSRHALQESEGFVPKADAPVRPDQQQGRPDREETPGQPLPFFSWLGFAAQGGTTLFLAQSLAQSDSPDMDMDDIMFLSATPSPAHHAALRAYGMPRQAARAADDSLLPPLPLLASGHHFDLSV